MKFLEDIQLRIGCYWFFLLVSAFLLLIALFPTFGATAFWLFLLMLLSIFFGFVYYQHYAAGRLKSFTAMLIKTGKKKLLIEDSHPYVLLKKGKACNRFLTTHKEYKVGIIYFSDEFLTLSTKCPPFNLFKLARDDIKKKWAIKKTCAVNKEFYYAYIQSVHFNPESKKLDIVLTSGDIESIESDKKQADEAVIELRKRLRNTGRSIQTNPIKS
jgi:hypothetical protein